MSTATMHRGKKANGTNPVGFGRVPQLLNGDHLTVPEFERRYYSMPSVKGAELIEGIVIMPSSVNYAHAEAHSLLAGLLGSYVGKTPGYATCIGASIRLDGANEYQPDVLLWDKSGQHSRIKVASDGLLDGSPDFVAEIAVSSASYDLHEKKKVYERCRVPEYLVWRLGDARIQWFTLHNGAYMELTPRSDSVIRSRVFPGLWLNLHALLAGNVVKAWRVLGQGLKSPEHRAFKRKLRTDFLMSHAQAL